MPAQPDATSTDSPRLSISFDLKVIGEEIEKGILRQLQGVPFEALITPLSQRASDQTAAMIKEGKFDDLIRQRLSIVTAACENAVIDAVDVMFKRALAKRAGEIIANMNARGVLDAAIEAEIRRRAEKVLETAPAGGT